MQDFNYYLEQFENGSMEVPTIKQLSQTADYLESEMHMLAAAEEPASMERIDKMMELLRLSSELDSIVKAVNLYAMRNPERLEQIALN